MIIYTETKLTKIKNLFLLIIHGKTFTRITKTKYKIMKKIIFRKYSIELVLFSKVKLWKKFMSFINQ